MVGDHLCHLPIKIAPPLFDGHYHGHHLTLVRGIVQRGTYELLAHVGHWLCPPPLVLADNCAKAVIAGICFQHKIACQIWQAKHRSSAKCSFEAVKSPLLGLSPHPWHFGAQQIGQWGSRTCKTIIEMVIVIIQTKELLNILG